MKITIRAIGKNQLTQEMSDWGELVLATFIRYKEKSPARHKKHNGIDAVKYEAKVVRDEDTITVSVVDKLPHEN